MFDFVIGSYEKNYHWDLLNLPEDWNRSNVSQSRELATFWKDSHFNKTTYPGPYI